MFWHAVYRVLLRRFSSCKINYGTSNLTANVHAVCMCAVMHYSEQNFFLLSGCLITSSAAFTVRCCWSLLYCGCVVVGGSVRLHHCRWILQRLNISLLCSRKTWTSLIEATSPRPQVCVLILVLNTYLVFT